MTRLALSVGIVTFLSVSYCVTKDDQPRRDQPSIQPVSVEDNAHRAQSLVREALYHEIYGRNQLRNELLKKASELEPHLQASFWHQGQILVNGTWKSDRQVVDSQLSDAEFNEYMRERNKAVDDESGNLAMADWCRERGMAKQERAHIDQALWHNPNNVAVRQRAGHVRVNGKWVHQQKVVDDAIQFQVMAERYVAWIDDLLAIRVQINSQSRNDYLQGIESLKAIDEPAAFVAIEVILGGHSEAVSQLIVEKLSKHANLETTDSLIRFSIYNPWPGIRKLAASELQKRNKFTVVPTLLGELKSSIQQRYEIIPGQRGNIIFRQVFAQELHTEQNVVEIETVYNRPRVGGTRGGDSIKKSIKHMRQSAQENLMTQSMRNLNARKVNSRVVDALQIATGESLGDDPHAWWNWWNQYNEVYLPGKKQTTTSRFNRNITVVDRNLTWLISALDYRQRMINSQLAQQGDQASQRGRVAKTEDSGKSTVENETPSDLSRAGNRGTSSDPQPTPTNPSSDPQPERNPRPESDPRPTGEIPSGGNPGEGTGGYEPLGTDTESADSECECLVAGTLVWTNRGRRPVEQITVGDVVLSQNVESGKMEYRPVLRPTERPETTIVHIDLENGDRISSSGGHPFWVSGEGWVKARSLTEGMLLHAPTGSIAINRISSGPAVKLFNLVVESNHNYFVGNAKVLSHDNTLRRATRSIVPGLQQ